LNRISNTGSIYPNFLSTRQAKHLRLRSRKVSVGKATPLPHLNLEEDNLELRLRMEEDIQRLSLMAGEDILDLNLMAVENILGLSWTMGEDSLDLS